MTSRGWAGGGSAASGIAGGAAGASAGGAGDGAGRGFTAAGSRTSRASVRVGWSAASSDPASRRALAAPGRSGAMVARSCSGRSARGRCPLLDSSPCGAGAGATRRRSATPLAEAAARGRPAAVVGEPAGRSASGGAIARGNASRASAATGHWIGPAGGAARSAPIGAASIDSTRSASLAGAAGRLGARTARAGPGRRTSSTCARSSKRARYPPLSCDRLIARRAPVR